MRRGPCDPAPLRDRLVEPHTGGFAVRQRYGLTIDRREADALDQILAGCTSTELITFARGEVPAAAAASVPEAIAAWDDNRNGRVSCAEARAHGIAPVTRDHPAYPFMRDGDGDGVVCESGSRSVSPASSLSSPRASGTGCGPYPTARRCGAIIPTASRVATVRISGGWTATTTAGPANGRRCSAPDTATRKTAVGRRVGAPGFVSNSEEPTSTTTRSRTSPRIDVERRRANADAARAMGSAPIRGRLFNRRAVERSGATLPAVTCRASLKGAAASDVPLTVVRTPCETCSACPRARPAISRPVPSTPVGRPVGKRYRPTVPEGCPSGRSGRPIRRGRRSVSACPVVGIDPRGDCRDRQLPGATSARGTVNAAYGWRTHADSGSSGPFSVQKDGPGGVAANDRVRPGVTVTDGSVPPA